MLRNFSQFTRSFSLAGPVSREWRLVESRRVAQSHEFKTGDEKPVFIPQSRKSFPEYKYGESQIFKQSNKGLYGGSFLQFGNNVSESKTKTRRRWLPNIVRKGLWSETLNRKISIKMTTKVLRTISKEGGIDNYLTKEKSARIKELGPTGWKLRYRVLQKAEQVAKASRSDAPVAEDANGNLVKIYYEGEIDGQTLRITAGRRKLMQLLFPLEKLERKADGEEFSYKQFVIEFGSVSAEQLLSQLVKRGLDVKTISV
ncbi:LAMI_0C02278g1_1 [Lachancea mirantina]|uniref:Large ribosomal subunit protein bL28m n=1 Tax=Lachancea mirantina TaxID=1230905 RepID=A0A1G4J0Z7_9SACH|nr:LAMI_0C02278g1_1 [Lachancea mirantina]